jgi:hypothetical protein
MVATEPGIKKNNEIAPFYFGTALAGIIGCPASA